MLSILTVVVAIGAFGKNLLEFNNKQEIFLNRGIEKDGSI